MINAIARRGAKKKPQVTRTSKIQEIYEKEGKHGKARPTPCIDDEVCNLLKAGLAQPRWHQDSALAFGKRTLEIAAHLANAELEKNTGKAKEDWARSHNLASKAATGIDIAVKDVLGVPADAPISASRTSTIDLLVSPLASIYRMKARRLGEKSLIPQSREQAKKDATALYDAAVILRSIAEESLRQRDAIADSRQNEGKPEKAAFVRVMMEAWIFLTGKLASENNTHFKAFVTAGWTDLTGQEDHSWEQAIRKAKKSIAPRDTAAIAERGPLWG
jgi:hypothetical protein